jgi:glycosyltransferase involved in cell wall biosynthesis
MRLTVVLTHPIQYYSSWFRYIAAHAPEISLTVVHAVQPTAEQQGVGFDQPFTWDTPLLDGCESIVVRPTRPGERIDSSHFWGLDVPEVTAAVERTSPDVALITGWYSVTLVRALRACRRLGVPVLYRGDSHLLSGPVGWRRPLWSLKTWLLLRQFDGFLSPGRRVTEYLRRFGVASARIFSVPHGVDNDLFAESAAPFGPPCARERARRDWGIDADAFVPMFVGKLTRSKRPLNVARAIAHLGGKTTFLVVGTGPLQQELEAEARRLGVDLRLAGFLNQTELGRAYAVADCLTLPSDFPETWGLVVNEALATGLPVVVSDAVGCAPDLVVDGETGYVYPLDNIDELAGRLDTIRRRKAEGYDWGPACRSLVARYSYPRMTAGLIDACRVMTN